MHQKDILDEVMRDWDNYDVVTFGCCSCIRLKKALYGLKQPPRAWNKNINDTLHRLHFRQLQSEPCLYISSP